MVTIDVLILKKRPLATYVNRSSCGMTRWPGTHFLESQKQMRQSKLPDRYKKVDQPPGPPPGPFRLRDVFKLAMMAFFNNVIKK
jgi:hypothetical protein